LEILIECVYDEVWGDEQQSLTRWFEIEAESPIFDFSVNPISAEDLLNTELGENDILSVAPEGSAGDLSTAPQSISLGMNFYQYSKENKRLISIDIAFDNM
jgi:hypothetical protein